jgi:predicted outer membrane repeat protein
MDMRARWPLSQGPKHRATPRRAGRTGAGAVTRRRSRAVLVFLEDRTLLSVAPQTYLVTNLNDSGPGSLRDAIASANADSYPASAYDTIQFDSPLAGGTINLAMVGDTTVGPSALTITRPIHIDGSTAPGLTIARSSEPETPAFRIFAVSTSGDLTLEDLAISGGQDDSGYGGGGLYNNGTLTLTGDTFIGNSADYGGGFYNDNNGTATLTDDSFTGNSASYDGGGLINYGAATLTNVAFTSNSATYGGGLDNESGGTATVSGSSFTSNFAGSDGGGLSNFGTATVSGSSFTSNSAGSAGGGIFTDSGTLTQSGNTFTGNQPDDIS